MTVCKLNDCSYCSKTSTFGTGSVEVVDDEFVWLQAVNEIQQRSPPRAPNIFFSPF